MGWGAGVSGPGRWGRGQQILGKRQCWRRDSRLQDSGPGPTGASSDGRLCQEVEGDVGLAWRVCEGGRFGNACGFASAWFS